MVLGRLIGAWRGWRSRRPVSVELDVTDQLVLQYLLRFSGRSAREVHREVNMRRALITYELVAYSLYRLEGGGLVQRVAAPDGSGPHPYPSPNAGGGDGDPSGEAAARPPAYRVTPLGRRLDGRLPESPRSNVEFYL